MAAYWSPGVALKPTRVREGHCGFSTEIVSLGFQIFILKIVFIYLESIVLLHFLLGLGREEQSRVQEGVRLLYLLEEPVDLIGLTTVDLLGPAALPVGDPAEGVLHLGGVAGGVTQHTAHLQAACQRQPHMETRNN